MFNLEDYNIQDIEITVKDDMIEIDIILGGIIKEFSIDIDIEKILKDMKNE